MVDIECPVCGKKYQANETRLKFGRQTTCSKECSYIKRGINISKRFTYNCSNCGKSFERTKKGAESKHNNIYCSPKCMYEGRSKGLTKRVCNKPYNIINKLNEEQKKEIAKRIWGKRFENGTNKHSEKTKQILSEITTNNIATGKINRISNIEYIISDILYKNNIKFIHQYPIRSLTTGRFLACVDFFIENNNTVIEVNGTFWHADKRFYTLDSLKPSQIRTLEKYNKKISLLESLGLKLIEIWEFDIKNDMDLVLNLILKNCR